MPKNRKIISYVLLYLKLNIQDLVALAHAEEGNFINNGWVGPWKNRIK